MLIRRVDAARGRIARTAVASASTGSLNAGVAQWLLDSGRIQAPYIARQGTALGRRGRPHISVEDGSVWVGGRTTTCVRGQVEL